MKIARKEQAKHNVDMLLVELSALLHDIADSKVQLDFIKTNKQYGGSDDLQKRLVQEFLSSNNCSQELIDNVLYVIMNVSFRKELGSVDQQRESCIELDIVKDADRLDAIGAVGKYY